VRNQAHPNAKPTYKSPQDLKKAEQDLAIVHSTILEHHLAASTVVRTSPEDQKKERLLLAKARKGTNTSANHSELPKIEPPSTPHGFTEMWYEVLKQRKELGLKNVTDRDTIKAFDRDCRVFILLNACFGNSFIDLAKYMAKPSTLNSKILERYKDVHNAQEAK